MQKVVNYGYLSSFPSPYWYSPSFATPPFAHHALPASTFSFPCLTLQYSPFFNNLLLHPITTFLLLSSSAMNRLYSKTPMPVPLSHVSLLTSGRKHKPSSSPPRYFLLALGTFSFSFSNFKFDFNLKFAGSIRNAFKMHSKCIQKKCILYNSLLLGRAASYVNHSYYGFRSNKALRRFDRWKLKETCHITTIIIL